MFDFQKNYLETTNPDENTVKKMKYNSCVVCLGLLQDICMDSVVEKVVQSEDVKSYDSNVFTCSVSFPASIYVREHSTRLDLENRYPDYFTRDILETQLNKVWKWIIRSKIEEKLSKKFECSDVCDFSINIVLKYELDAKELSVLSLMQPDFFNVRQVQKRKYRGEIYSRKSVLEALSKTSIKGFNAHACVPPEVSDKFLFCDDVSCMHNSIYIAGRFVEFLRVS